MAHMAGGRGAVGLAAFTGEDGWIRREADRVEREQLCPRMGARGTGLQPMVGMALPLHPCPPFQWASLALKQ